MTEPSRHWVCAACERVHEVEPLRCVACGGAEFTEIAVHAHLTGLPTGGGIKVTSSLGMGATVVAKMVERKR